MTRRHIVTTTVGDTWIVEGSSPTEVEERVLAEYQERGESPQIFYEGRLDTFLDDVSQEGITKLSQS